MDGGQGDSIVLEEEIDPNYEPTEKEVLEYATWLGMDLDAERDLFWIAREGLKAPLPENWKPCKTTDTEEIYYFNFATGQSTWDHPCDEFYRNLYEEHKKKHQTKDIPETDEKKMKAKEDVAELLGRKGGGKKKKGALAKTEPLGGPSLGKVNTLEKKPLPGLSGRLGSLGSNGIGGAGLKPVASLGPRKSEAKKLGGAFGLDSAPDDLKSDELAKPLSRAPLGSVLGKKPLLSSPATTTSMASGTAKADLASSDFEEKREKLTQDYAEKLQAIQDAHESKLETLQKKLKAQLEDVQDAEEMKLKQLKREFGKKKNDLENQFDREENALQCSRKDQLKRLETESENVVSLKKKDLDREFKSETDKLILRHEGKLREIRDDFEQEEKQLTEKMRTLFGEKKETAQLATELKAEVERLQDHQKALERELSTVRSENDALIRDKETAEKERDDAQREVEEVRRELSAAPSTVLSEECTKCSAWEKQVSTLNAECADAQNEVERVRKELEALRREHQHQATSEGEKDGQMNAFRDQEAVLKQEITALQQQLATLKAESTELRSKCAALQTKSDTAGQGESSSAIEESGQLEALQRQLIAAHADMANTKSELSDLQDQHAVILTTNAQIKEQLMKELKERKLLRAQLDSNAEEGAQQLVAEVEKYQKQLQSLQQHVESELRARQEQEATCAALRKDMNALEQEKHEVDAKLRQLESDRDQLKSEVVDGSDGKLRLIDLEKEVGRLLGLQSNLEKELSALRCEKETLLQDKGAAESQCRLAQGEIEGLRKRLSDSSSSASQKCAHCSVWEAQVSSLKSEYSETLNDVSEARKELTELKQETEAQLAAERERAKAAITTLQQEIDAAAKAFRDQEAFLKQEITVLQQKLTALEAESNELRTKCDFLQSEKETADRRESDMSSSASVAREQSKALERQLVAAQTEVSTTKAELLGLQDKYAAIQTTNAQMKEQLMKESNEKKMFLEQLKAKTEEATQRLAASTNKHQQQILSLQQQLESESRTRRDREDACDALRKEMHTLEKAKRKVDAELGQLESDKRHVESEKTILSMHLDEMNMSRKRDEKSVMSVEESLANKKLEAEQLRANLKVVETDKAHLESRMKVLNQDFEQLAAKTHRLEAEYESERARSRTVEKERDTASQRQHSLVDELETSERKYRTLTAEVSELQGLLNKSKANEQAAASKVEQTVQKLRQLEQQAERDGFAMKMKLHQVEVEHENVIHGKERADLQLQAREKELTAAKDEVTKRESEIESLQARVKSLLSDKEEVQAALLNANMANMASASANRESAKSISASTDVMLVKLLLADTNKNELELHLADISSQLENSTRRCASLEARCRDQSVEIEALHVEVASLRSASQKMHMSALESLPLTERLEYEHKKRTLRSDFLNQLRDFQEREERALVRHKARLRAQYERHLEDLGAELEKMRQHRVEQEEAVSVQMMQQIRQERDVQRNEVKRQVREELKQFEQELQERKARDIEIISKAIEREEDELSARLREIRQVSREEELAKQHKSCACEDKGEVSRDPTPASPGQLVTRRSANRRSQPESLIDEVGDNNGGKRTKANNQRQHSTVHHWKKSTKAYQKWKQRLQQEVDLLVNARTLVANQRQGLTRQAHQLKASKSDWKRKSRSSEANPLQGEMKRMLDENMANWSEGMRNLRRQEAWVKQREQKLAKMRRAVERLKRGHAGGYERDNNLSGPSESSSGEDDDEALAEWSDYSNQSELESTLAKLEMLEEELTFDIKDFSGGPPGEIDDRLGSSNFQPVYQIPPQQYAIQREPSYGYPPTTAFGHFVPRRTIHTARDLVGQDMRWLRSQRNAFGLRGDRFTVAPASNSASRADQVYQQKISRWARGREKVQHAATNHATWLSGLCEELKEYGAKYTRAEDAGGGGQFVEEED